MKIPKMAGVKTVESFREITEHLGINLPIDDQLESGDDSPLGQSIAYRDMTIGNRFSILPMEGWDATEDGRPSDLTRRRWRKFGESGAKLIWGGEAVAVQPEGRANPNQLMLNDSTLGDIESLRLELESTHKEHFDTTDDLLIGLQLTHSGRYARPNNRKQAEPRIMYRHPVLDPRVDIDDDSKILSDGELDKLVDDFVKAAVLAQKAGYKFVDVKHCHGYLGHEILSSYDRPGPYGGDFEGRTKFIRDITSGIKAEAPGLDIGIRLSVFDFMPFQRSAEETGEPAVTGDYKYAFGGDSSGLGIDLTETNEFMKLLKELDIRLLCTTAGSPYYNPHIQRPAQFPPSDGYLPPENPLVGVARQINAVAEIKKANPDMLLVGSGYSFLQDWLAHVGQNVIRTGGADFIGLGRMVLSYPDLPADVIAGNPSKRTKICRTFSDCTTAPRNGMISGCYPLDPFYRAMPETKLIKSLGRK